MAQQTEALAGLLFGYFLLYSGHYLYTSSSLKGESLVTANEQSNR